VEVVEAARRVPVACETAVRRRRVAHVLSVVAERGGGFRQTATNTGVGGDAARVNRQSHNTHCEAFNLKGYLFRLLLVLSRRSLHERYEERATRNVLHCLARTALTKHVGLVSGSYPGGGCWDPGPGDRRFEGSLLKRSPGKDLQHPMQHRFKEAFTQMKPKARAYCL